MARAGGHRHARVRAAVPRQFDLGVDGVIMHGATPTELAPVVAAYRDIRPTGASTARGQPRGTLTRTEGRIRGGTGVVALS